MNYFVLLRKQAYFGVLIIMVCACLGSIRGAWKENQEGYIGVTQEDQERMGEAGVSAPEMIGVMGLAAEQNRWHNFGYAYHYALRGVMCYCILMAFYCSFYHCRFFERLRVLVMENDEKGPHTADDPVKKGSRE